jgi:hypothetical protein
VTVQRPFFHTWDSLLLAIVIGLPLVVEAGQAEMDSCILPARHAGVMFPVEHVEDSWACRLQPITSNYTTANKIGPVRTALTEEVYGYLLDHPPMAAHLVNRLDLGLYKATAKASDVFWGTDGEGTEGVVQLVYRDRFTRIYYLEGRHDGTFLPPVTGKAVALLRIQPVQGLNGSAAVETTLVAYLQLDNRFLSGVLSVLRPLIGKVVTRQFMKAFHAADRLGELMRQDPERVLFEAMDPPPLPDDQVAFLKHVLSNPQFTGPAMESTLTFP